MKTSYKDFKIMLLRPAVSDGKEVEICMDFDNDSIYRTQADDALSLGLKPGDTAHIRGKIRFDGDNSQCEYITLYMSESLLEEFIEKYGFYKICASVRMKAVFNYVLQNKEYGLAEQNEELLAFKLSELITEHENDSIYIQTPELRDYFEDGMK